MGRRRGRDRRAALRQPGHRGGDAPGARGTQHQGCRPAPAARPRRGDQRAGRYRAGGQDAAVGHVGGTITITNVGVFGIDTGTPILQPGEAAILAFGPSGSSRGCTRARSGRAGSRRSASPSTTGSSTANPGRGSSPTSLRFWRTRRRPCLGMTCSAPCRHLGRSSVEVALGSSLATRTASPATLLARHLGRSRRVAMPCPTPMHMVAST